MLVHDPARAREARRAGLKPSPQEPETEPVEVPRRFHRRADEVAAADREQERQGAERLRAAMDRIWGW